MSGGPGARRKGEAVPTPAVDTGDPEPTAREVVQLRAFLDGSMMVPDVRHHLRRAWGFCPRHTWLHATVELELRTLRPLATAILYEDLTRHAAGAAGRRSLLVQRLRPRAECFTCSHLALDREAPADARRLRESAAALERTRAWMLPGRELWEERACPRCLGGHGLVCRQHLLRGEPVPSGLAGHLEALADRLDAFVVSLTWRGEPVTSLEAISWIEALGWFAGWDYAAKLAATARPECV